MELWYNKTKGENNYGKCNVRKMDSEKNYIIVIEWLWEYKPQGKNELWENGQQGKSIAGKINALF